LRDVFAVAGAWLEEGRDFALATLVALRAAATAPIGTTIAVDARGQIVGNIGAGCYEGDVVEACLLTAADGRSRTLDINLTGDDELMGGTACGAVMEIVVWRPNISFAAQARDIAAGVDEVRMTISYERADRGSVSFEHLFEARGTLVLVGATSLAAEIAAIARRLDFHVVVVDPRPAFATTQRVPDAHELVREWPDDYLPRALGPRTAIVALSHDPKFDVPALACALRSEAPFIGLLGSRQAQAARRASLRERGFDEDALARVRGPVGLDIGGATTAETAVSILAELVAVLRRHDGAPLSRIAGSIHRR
jgi:xanthine dehydrogenase accessory factor